MSASGHLRAKVLPWLVSWFIACASAAAFAGPARATGSSLDFTELDASHLKEDAAARFYHEVIGRWPAARRWTAVGLLTVEMLDQKEPTIPWVVMVLRCRAEGSSTPHTLTFVAKRDVWTGCCDGVEDPDRAWTAVYFLVKGGTWRVRPTKAGFEVESMPEALKPAGRVGKF